MVVAANEQHADGHQANEQDATADHDGTDHTQGQATARPPQHCKCCQTTKRTFSASTLQTLPSYQEDIWVTGRCPECGSRAQGAAHSGFAFLILNLI